MRWQIYVWACSKDCQLELKGKSNILEVHDDRVTFVWTGQLKIKCSANKKAVTWTLHPFGVLSSLYIILDGSE